MEGLKLKQSMFIHRIYMQIVWNLNQAMTIGEIQYKLATSIIDWINKTYSYTNPP